jgi:hypothetical protein
MELLTTIFTLPWTIMSVLVNLFVWSSIVVLAGRHIEEYFKEK